MILPKTVLLIVGKPPLDLHISGYIRVLHARLRHRELVAYATLMNPDPGDGIPWTRPLKGLCKDNEKENGSYYLSVLGFPKLGVPTIMENQMENKMDNEMEAGII